MLIRRSTTLLFFFSVAYFAVAIFLWAFTLGSLYTSSFHERIDPPTDRNLFNRNFAQKSYGKGMGDEDEEGKLESINDENEMCVGSADKLSTLKKK